MKDFDELSLQIFKNVNSRNKEIEWVGYVVDSEDPINLDYSANSFDEMMNGLRRRWEHNKRLSNLT